MTARHSLRSSISAAILLAALHPYVASAQMGPPPPERPVLDENNVGVTGGLYTLTSPELSIGEPGSGGLSFTRYNSLNGVWRHSYSSNLVVNWNFSSTPAFTNIATADLGNQVNYYLEYTPKDGDGSYLSGAAGTAWTWIRRDGSVVHFTSILSGAYDYLVGDEISYPNGDITKIYYKSDGVNARVQSIVTNRGYQLKLEYETDPLGSTGFFRLTKVTAINNAIEYCDPLADHCILTGSWPVSTYTFSTGEVTDPIGRVTRFGGSGSTTSIKLPGSSSYNINYYTGLYYDLIAQYNLSRVTSVLRDGQTWTYSYSTSGINETLTVTDPLSKQKVYNYILGQPAADGTLPSSNTLTSYKDPLNRTTSFQFDSWYRLTRVTAPEGNYWEYIYDARGNRTQTIVHAKPGSGLTNITTSASFPSTCSNIKTCNKPTSVTDARNNVTSYTYDTTHGGVLTETGPAVNGVSPVKRSAYVQKYAWVKNSSGSYVQATSPVWLLSEERTCRTTATTGNACSGGASDEVVTTYDYGPNSGPNNLHLRGVAVTSNGTTLRTCYGYDILGRRISETRPRAGLSSCS